MPPGLRPPGDTMALPGDGLTRFLTSDPKLASVSLAKIF